MCLPCEYMMNYRTNATLFSVRHCLLSLKILVSKFSRVCLHNCFIRIVLCSLEYYDILSLYYTFIIGIKFGYSCFLVIQTGHLLHEA